MQGKAAEKVIAAMQVMVGTPATDSAAAEVNYMQHMHALALH